MSPESRQVVVPAGAAPEPEPLTELSARRLGPVRRYFATHPVAMDVLVMVVFGVSTTGAAGMVGVGGSPAIDPRTRLVVGGVVLPLLGTALLFWRRRRPLLVTAVMAAAGAVTLLVLGTTAGFETGVAFGLYAVAAARSPRVTWAAFAGSTVLLGGAAWLWERDLTTLSDQLADGEVVLSAQAARITTLSTIVAIGLLAVAIGTSVRNRRLHVAELVARTQELARERDREASLARAAERTRIAREMHDVVAHSISVMIALADGAEATVDRSPERARDAIDELAATGRGALADMRRVLGVLDPGEGDGGADADLDAVVERFRTAGLTIRVTGLAVLHEHPAPDPGLELALRRIVTEALTNVLRHAPGTPGVDLVVALRPEDGMLVVDVTDRGARLPVHDAGGAGQGVIGMRERAELHGGRVEAGPWETGWRVRAELPWAATEEETPR